MNTSRILAALVLAAGASLAYGCGSSSFKSCEKTRSCGNSGGTDGGMAGSGGTAGSAGTGATGGNGGSIGTDGGAGTGGTAGGGGTAGTAGSAGSDGGPTLDDNGATCSDGSTCKTGNCIDGVCCDTKCDGTCEACNVSGNKGTCTPYKSGTDPEKECLGGASASATCAGTCDGKSACAFPDATTSCGNPMCAAGKQTTYGCGGDGTCSSPKQKSCGNYTCGSTACRTSCTSDTQCASTAWCQANKCVAKIADGGSCGGNNQCTSGHCIGGVCCHTSCAAPNSCATGTCLCNGVSCASGHSCIMWYLDQDDDKHGASSSHDKPGCDDQQPSDVNGHHYVQSNDDCYDNNINAYPGQTQYFPGDRGDGSYDYNCDGNETTKYLAKNGAFGTATCHDCGVHPNVGTNCLSCGSSPIAWGTPVYSIGYYCSTSTCGVSSRQAFVNPVPCGGSGALYTCSTNSCSTAETNEGSKAQLCR